MKKKTSYTMPDVKVITMHVAGVIATSSSEGFEGIGSGDSHNVDDFKW